MAFWNSRALLAAVLVTAVLPVGRLSAADATSLRVVDE